MALVLLLPVAAWAEGMTLAAPAALVENGFLKHLLPRFGFKHGVRVSIVGPDVGADVGLAPFADQGTPVFRDSAGTVYAVVEEAPSKTTGDFLDWLLSEPGRNAIEGFPSGGPPLFTAYAAAEKAVAAAPITGNGDLGAILTLKHCGRCHVIDDRNRMGGNDMSPSLEVLRARDNWQQLFKKFWQEPPHPSFTQVHGLTEEFTSESPSRIVPVVLDQTEVDAIMAFIASLPPKILPEVRF